MYVARAILTGFALTSPVFAAVSDKRPKPPSGPLPGNSSANYPNGGRGQSAPPKWTQTIRPSDVKSKERTGQAPPQPKGDIFERIKNLKDKLAKKADKRRDAVEGFNPFSSTAQAEAMPPVAKYKQPVQGYPFSKAKAPAKQYGKPATPFGKRPSDKPSGPSKFPYGSSKPSYRPASKPSPRPFGKPSSGPSKPSSRPSGKAPKPVQKPASKPAPKQVSSSADKPVSKAMSRHDLVESYKDFKFIADIHKVILDKPSKIGTAQMDDYIETLNVIEGDLARLKALHAEQYEAAKKREQSSAKTIAEKWLNKLPKTLLPALRGSGYSLTHQQKMDAKIHYQLGIRARDSIWKVTNFSAVADKIMAVDTQFKARLKALEMLCKGDQYAEALKNWR